jgi:large repetitive protein
MTSSQGVTNVNTASATLVGSGSTDISITKDDGVTQLSAGETIAYTLIITNTSSVNGAAGLPVADTPPVDISITGWTCAASSGSSCASATGSAGPLATTVTLLPSGQATIAVAALVDQASSATSLTNTATINPAAASITDTNSSNNSASDTDTIVRRADIAIAKTVSDPNPKVGNTIVFTITATNNGPSRATAVTVTDSLPAGYTLASATPDIGSYAAPIWTVGDLDSGDVATLTVVVTVNPTGPYANTASGATSTTDPVSSNNSATITPSTVNLTIVKSSQLISDPINGTTNPKVIPGAIIDYTLTISNSGTAPIDANTIVIEDNLPPETMPYVSTATGPPIIFANGTTASGLNYSYGANTNWSNQSGGGPPYTYPPSPDTSGYDAAATAFRISPTGTMVAGTASTPSSFTLTYRVKVR